MGKAIEGDALIHRVKIQGVDDQIHIAEKLGPVLSVHSSLKEAKIALRIDGPSKLSEDLDLRFSDRLAGRSELSVEILKSEDVQVGDIEILETQSKQVVEVMAAHASQPRDGDPLS